MSTRKRSDLFREYARVIDMCEGTEVTAKQCVRIHQQGHGDTFMAISEGYSPEFTDPPNNYTFAVAILEDEPLFVGDKVYWKHDGSEFEWGIVNHRLFSWGNDLTRTPPKRTFTLAGRELPVPAHDPSLKVYKQVGDMKYYFDSSDDANRFSLSIQAIIHEAIENARLQNK